MTFPIPVPRVLCQWYPFVAAAGALILSFASFNPIADANDNVTDATNATYATTAKNRPNVLVVVTDDQGYGDLSAHGNPLLQTPSMDRLHRTGCRLQNFMVAPTCAPTRAQWFSGRHEFRNGISHTILERERMRLDSVLLPEALKTAGYRTGIFGKWHLGDDAPYQPNRRGFDEVFIHGAGGIGQSYQGSCGDAPGNTYFNPVILHNGKFERTQGYCTDVFFSKAKEWIREQSNRNDPWFAWIATNAPHAPYNARPEDRALFRDKGLSEAEENFFGMLHNIDVNLGQTLDLLEELKIRDNTLVIFMNDNGGTEGVKTFNAGMRGAKGTPWIGGTRGFSLWSWPDKIEPRDCHALTSAMDLFPTLLEIATIPRDEPLQKQIEGRSIAPLLFRQQMDADWPSRTLFTHVGRWPKGESPDDSKYKNCAVRTERFTLVSINGGKSPRWQLFDIQQDFGQKQDIAKEQPEIVNSLQKEYDQWWSEVRPQLVNEDAPLAKANAFKILFEEQKP